MKTILLVTALTAGFALQATAQETGQTQGDDRMSFEMLDADGNGAVTLEELQAASDARFAEADTDGDGGLSAEELVVQRTAAQLERAATRATEMVAHLDDNGDGLLQADELSDARRPLDRVLGRLDTDENGEVSEAEFEARQDRDGGGGRRHGGDRNGGGRDRG